MRKTLSNNPWIFVIGFFLAFVGVWVAFITFAVKNQPPSVPLDAKSPAAETTDGGD